VCNAKYAPGLHVPVCCFSLGVVAQKALQFPAPEYVPSLRHDATDKRYPTSVGRVGVRQSETIAARLNKAADAKAARFLSDEKSLGERNALSIILVVVREAPSTRRIKGSSGIC
jgi:hypothetical protein